MRLESERGKPFDNRDNMRYSWTRLFITVIAGVLSGLLMCSLSIGAEADSVFPKIKGKFGSNALSYELHGQTIDYGGKIQLIFDEGKLYRRRDSVSYDCYFLGRGRAVMLDTSGLDVSWRHRFGDSTTVAFVSAYLCGSKIPFLLNLDPTGWQPDKIKRPEWQKLQFMVKAPDRYFWVSLPGELGLWLDRDPFPLPVWADLGLASGEQVVLYLSTDVSEQLNVYLYDKKFDAPYLLAGYNLEQRLGLSAIEIDSTVIRVHLRESGKINAACDMFFPQGSDLRGIKLALPYLYEVDSVLDTRGEKLPFIKETRRTNLYVAPRPEIIDKPDKISVYYKGKLFEARLAGVDLPVNITTWFPHLPQRYLGRYTLHYTLHKDLELISVGTKIGETFSGDQKTVSYRTDNISYVSFAYGLYDIFSDTAQGIPLTLYVRRENNLGVFNRHIPKNVLADLREACSTYVAWYGPPLAKSIRIVDQPWSAGQSSPGLIHLSQVSFQTNRDQARFRAHEMAHQWWGHTVTPKTFRDMWLSEGLAEYSAAMFLVNVKHDSAAYLELVDHWRGQIIEKGRINGYYSRGYRAGPIVMGARLLLSYSPGDYITLVYFKAAYLLQMLRFEIDGPSYRTDFFNMMLADYRRVFFERQASSVDFIRVAMQRLGDRRTEAFFGQWLYGWKVPIFSCGYKVTTDEKGRQLLSLTITVSEAEEGFDTPFPVAIEFVDGTRELFRLDGIGHIADHRLGPFPQAIKTVRFDPGHIVLSRGAEVVGD